MSWAYLCMISTALSNRLQSDERKGQEEDREGGQRRGEEVGIVS